MAIYNMSALNSQLSSDSSTGTYSDLQYQDYIAVSCQMPNVLEYNKVVRITFSCDFTGGTIPCGVGINYGSAGVTGIIGKGNTFSAYLNYNESNNYIWARIPQEIRESVTFSATMTAITGHEASFTAKGSTFEYTGSVIEPIKTYSNCTLEGDYYATNAGDYMVELRARNGTAKYANIYYFLTSTGTAYAEAYHPWEITKADQYWTADDMSLTVGEIKQIFIDGTTYGSMSYSVADREIATLDTLSSPAKVRGEAPGRTTVTITAEGDNNHNLKNFDIIIVVSAGKEDQTWTLTIDPIPVGSTKGIRFSSMPIGEVTAVSGNTSIATVDTSSGVQVTGKAIGTTDITVRASGNESYNARTQIIQVQVIAADTSRCRIRVNGAWVTATPYVYFGGWKKARAYIYSGGWKKV